MCTYISGCDNSKFGSYCKSWLTSPVCFGLAKKSDGSICFEPTDADCHGEPIACGAMITTEVPITEASTTDVPITEVPTTEVPTTEVPTTEVPTTEVPTTEVPTTEVPTTEVPTTEVPTTEVHTTEVHTTEVHTTEVPTTEVPTTEVPTTEVPTTEVPTTEVPTTEVPTTEVPTTQVPTAEVPTTEVSTTETATTEIVATTSTTSSVSEGFRGNYCGKVYGESFSVDFDENGRATVSVLGQSAGADYEVAGNDIVFSKYDSMLQQLMDMFHIKSIRGTIISSTEIHIKAGFLIDTTLTSC
ncbi:protein PRY2 precursor, putative [Perkinsus marinus ATCC 50983]|uniref:Protein PRY2, putative n=1 Tax=Perkinsus marinus (strain ATCC 50983 / TXsc) TaxID=423536 RepID=C5L5H4_PERM5|nr:protein PRY2 precursor, putative [Perkinsus marinus ATCC 50983]EER08019.1 protein PRY2 precursor, putative [Perkinsus marinus ATCC 50983]|eukprot:XP_002776203.1 protein PRY2 precursor, putative [Perkinsus marinus ATCC 50983]